MSQVDQPENTTEHIELNVKERDALEREFQQVNHLFIFRF